jgi:hypothetical protein
LGITKYALVITRPCGEGESNKQTDVRYWQHKADISAAVIYICSGGMSGRRANHFVQTACL